MSALQKGHLVYRDKPINFLAEMMSLTDMWKAAGSPAGLTPAEWQRSADGSRFIEFVAESYNMGISHVLNSKAGKGGGTWAHWQIALAYAKKLSPEFHAWCNTAAREKMVAIAGTGSTEQSPLKPRKSVAGFKKTFDGLREIAIKHLKLDEAQATIHACHGTDYVHGFNPLEAMRVSRLESPVEKSFFVVTDIAKREGFQSAQWLNKAFEAMGLHFDTGNEDCRWMPTDAGRPYCRVVDNPIKGRRSRQSLIWSLEVVPMVRAHMAQTATPYAAIAATPDADLLGGVA